MNKLKVFRTVILGALFLSLVLFIADCRKGFFIQVIDASGKDLYSISKNFAGVEITQEYKDKVMERYKGSKMWIENKRHFNYIFPKYFSDIKTLRLADSKIYIVTYHKKDNNNQLIIMDFNGRILKEVYIPFKSRLYDFKNDQYYYLEDIDENWNLFSINL